MDAITDRTECSAAPPAARATLRRARIIDTARRLFATQGIHNTGMAQIAKGSDVLVGQIYRDFACKEDIVAAIVTRDIDDFLRGADLQGAVARGDAAAVRAWIDDFLACDNPSDEDRGMIAEIIAEATRNPRVAVIQRELNDRLRHHLFRALAMLVPEPAKAARRDMLGEAILIVSGGIFHRRLTEETVDPAVVTAVTRFVARELDLLQRG